MSSVVDALAFVKCQLNLRCQFKKSKVFERETPSLRNRFLFPFNLCLWVVVDAWSASLIYGGQINLGQAPEYKWGLISLYRTWPSWIARIVDPTQNGARKVPSAEEIKWRLDLSWFLLARQLFLIAQQFKLLKSKTRKTTKHTRRAC